MSITWEGSLEMCSRSSSVRDLGGGFFTAVAFPLEPPLLPLLVIKGVPGFFLEQVMIVQVSRANERNKVALTTPMKTG